MMSKGDFDSTPLKNEIDPCLRDMASHDEETRERGKLAWIAFAQASLDTAGQGDSRPWESLVAECLDRRAAGNDFACSCLTELCLNRGTMGESDTGLALAIQVCLDRLAGGDEVSWDLLQEITYGRLIWQCELVLQHALSKSNPLITGNAVAGEVYLRLHKAMRENQSAIPKTAREYFGLAGRNIRWQIGDMLRKPKNEQADSIVFENLAESTGVKTQVERLELWNRFWIAVAHLPREQREVFDMLWIGGISQREAALQLELTRDRVKDIWREIKLTIARECKDLIPFLNENPG